MHIFLRIVKGLLGGIIAAIAFGLLMLPVLSVLGIEARSDIGIGIGMVVSLIGGILVGVMLSKSKWWMILVAAIVTFVIAAILMNIYPNGYA